MPKKVGSQVRREGVGVRVQPVSLYFFFLLVTPLTTTAPFFSVAQKLPDQLLLFGASFKSALKIRDLAVKEYEINKPDWR